MGFGLSYDLSTSNSKFSDVASSVGTRVLQAFIFVLISVIVLTTYYYVSLSRQVGPRKSYSQFGQDLWVLENIRQAPHQDAFLFLDIGANDGEFFSNTKLLELNGWEGVCADPFPTHFESRTCTLHSVPIYSSSSKHVRMQDCSEDTFNRDIRGIAGLSGIKRFIGRRWRHTGWSCPEVVKTTLGVADLVESMGLPNVIDYVNLDTEGTELTILQAFPFNSTCVRLWTVEHNYDKTRMKKIKKLLQRQGCAVRSFKVDFRAVCSCPAAASTSLETDGTQVVRHVPVKKEHLGSDESSMMRRQPSLHTD